MRDSGLEGGAAPTRVTTLGELLAALETLAPNTTIYTIRDRPLDLDSPAVAMPPSDTDPPIHLADADGMHYLLEGWLAREAIEVWSAWRGGRKPGPQDRLAAVVYYADNDAHLPADFG
jgi:hypothetical protein